MDTRMNQSKGVSRRQLLKTGLAAGAAALLAACGSSAAAPSAPASSAGGGSASAAKPASSGPASAAVKASGAPSPAQVPLYKGSDRQQVLDEGAKKEGTLLWYTTYIVDQLARPMQDAFQKKYPFIKLDFYRGNSTDLVPRVASEAKAGRNVVDVINGIDTLAQLKQAKLVQPFYSPSLDAYPSNLKDPDGTWAAMVQYNSVFGYNTKLVTKDQAPKTYEDLLDPKWSGKMIWSTQPSTGGPMFVGHVLTFKGEQAGMDYLQKLAKIGVRNTEAATRAVLDQVIGGEFAINVMTTLSHAVISKHAGAPVDWTEPVPLSSTFDAAGLSAASPHPHAALLFLDYLYSEEGQKLMSDRDYVPTRPGVVAKDPASQPNARGVKVDFYSGEVLLTKMPAWQKVFDQLFVH